MRGEAVCVGGLVQALMEERNANPPDAVPDECVRDPVAWVEWAEPYIECKRRGLIPFKPFDYQKHLMHCMAQGGGYVVDKGRQIGVSTAIMVAAAHQLLFHQQATGAPFHCHVMASREDVAGGVLLGIAIRALRTARLSRHQRRYLSLPTGRRTVRITYETRGASNYIQAHASTDTAGRSHAGNAIILDEAAFLRDAERVWASLAPFLDDAVNPSVFITSTYKSDGDWFSRCVDHARELGFVHIPLPWNVRPDRDESWKQESQRRFAGSLEAWKQEYELVRIKGSSTFADLAVLEHHASEHPFLGGTPNQSHKYVKGCDIAYAGRSLSVFTAVDVSVKPAQVVFQEAHSRKPVDERRQWLERFDADYPGALFVDGTNDPTFVALLRNCKKKFAVRITAGSQPSRYFEPADRLPWIVIPRPHLLSRSAALLERGSVIVHPEYFPELWLAIKSADLESKSRGQNVDYLDSLLLAIFQLTDRATTARIEAAPRMIRTRRRTSIPAAPSRQSRPKRW